jgi:hypothetical protein
MEKLQHRLVLKFRVNKIQNSGVYGPILLNELFHHMDKDCKSHIREGYLSITTTNKEKPEFCWHLWVENEGVKYDINREMAERNDEEFKVCEFDYMDSVEDDIKPKELYEQWKLYQEDKKEFWKQSPQKIKNFRTKMFNSNTGIVSER